MRCSGARTARALENLPQTADALREGSISYAKVRELDGGLHNSGCCSHDVPQAQRVESGTRAERYQVMVHCDAATLAAEGEPGRSDLDGIRVSADTSRRMACDAAVVAMVHAKDGALLNVGRRTRTIPPHIRRALEERDRGCRFPGCAGRAPARRRSWSTVNRDGTVLFFTPKGRILLGAPSAASAESLPPMRSAHSGAPSRGGSATLSNGAALYHDSAIPWAIEAAAREAVEASLDAAP